MPFWTDKHAGTIIRRLELNVFLWLGDKPIADITAPQLLQVIRHIEKRDALETAHRVLGFRPDFIEHQLAHAVHDPKGRAYNSNAHLPEHHKMMQAWVDYLAKLGAGANVIPLRQLG